MVYWHYSAGGIYSYNISNLYDDKDYSYEKDSINKENGIDFSNYFFNFDICRRILCNNHIGWKAL